MSEDFQRFLVVKTYLDPTIMCIIFIFGTVCNITLLVILARHKELRTSSNICIFTMASGDLMCVIVNGPIIYIHLNSNTWTVGVVLCKLMWFFSDFAVGVSIFAVTMLSVQRYRGIVNANIQSYNGPHVLKLRLISVLNFLLIWILSLIFAVRTAITADVTDGKCSSVAETYGQDLPKYIALFNLFVFCIFPLCFIVVFYSLTAYHLVASARDMPGEVSINQRKIICSRNKGAKIVVALTGVFFISYVPWFSWQVIAFWLNLSSDDNATIYTYTVLYYFFFGNLCFNPVALYCGSKTFRKHFNYYLFCGRKCSKFHEKDVEEVPTVSLRIWSSYSNYSGTSQT